MSRVSLRRDEWKQLVLGSLPPPAWLGDHAPDGEVVVSSRFRSARNLRKHRFPHHASSSEAQEVLAKVAEAAKGAGLPLTLRVQISEGERDHFLRSRLISPDFRPAEPGRALLIDPDQRVSIMVNEEDHIRLQALTAGWSVQSAENAGVEVLEALSERLEFARVPEIGFLTASPLNAGGGRRLSALFHLIGLAQAQRLPAILTALAVRNLTVRGLFGEASRAIGAFVQVSATRESAAELTGACDYLIQEERAARRAVPPVEVQARADAAVEFVTVSRELSLGDALKALAWARWASSLGLPGYPDSFRVIDSWVSTLEVDSPGGDKAANRARAVFLRERFGR